MGLQRDPIGIRHSLAVQTVRATASFLNPMAAPNDDLSSLPAEELVKVILAERERFEVEREAERRHVEAEREAERQRVESEREAVRLRVEAERLAERQRVEAERQDERRGFERERARNVFVTESSTASALAEVLALCSTAAFPALDNAALSLDYLPERLVDTSLLYAGSADSTSLKTLSTRVLLQDPVPMSGYRRQFSVGTPSHLQVFTWRLGADNDDRPLESALETFLCRKLFGGKARALNAFLDEQAAVLESLRAAYASLFTTTGTHTPETTGFQPVFILFIASILERLKRPLVVIAANTVEFETMIWVKSASKKKKGKPVHRRVRGFTDVIVAHKADRRRAVPESLLLRMVCHFELKTPFARLHRRQAYECKDQLLIESEVMGLLLSDDDNNARPVLSALTDLFVINVAVRLPARPAGGLVTAAPAGAAPPAVVAAERAPEVRHYIATRVLLPRQYLLRVLLLLSEPSEDELELLVTPTDGIVEAIEPYPDPVDEVRGNDANDDQPPRDSDEPSAPATRSKTKTVAAIPKPRRRVQMDWELRKFCQWDAARRGVEWNKENALVSESIAKERSRLRRCQRERDARKVLEWDTKRRGEVYLSATALAQHVATLAAAQQLDVVVG
eukprot:c17980_g1_i1.p1 GENE.c17980_g1_i1~~c17980_g1_i1.p1  ORF type:complete len:625 (-),score=94.66 c17980_g1_i1:566-2440(-)